MPKNQNLPDVNKFRTDFPLFSDDVRYPDAQVQFRLDLAGTMLNEKNTGKALFPYLVELFVAHYLVLYDQDRRAVAAGGSGGASTGAVSSKSVDKVSVSYDTSVTLNADAGFWNTTRYGAEFWQYLRLAGAGGRQL